MSSPSGTATIGLQVVLNDLATTGLAALGHSVIGVSKAVGGLNTLLVEEGPIMATVGAAGVAAVRSSSGVRSGAAANPIRWPVVATHR